MALDGTLFDEHLADFQEWQESPWGRLRYSIVAANLARHLGDRPLRILDVAGGNGRDAVRLATLGHHVTILDVAPASLAAARQFAAELGVADHVEVRQGDAHHVPGIFAHQDFDLMLCHNLLQFVSDRAALLDTLAQRMKPGGLLSVLAPNAYAMPLDAALRDLDLDAALRTLDARTRPNHVYRTDVAVLTAGEITGHLAAAGLDIAGHYGVLSVCGRIRDNDVKSDPEFFARLETLELALAVRMPYPLTASMFHLLAVKPPPDGAAGPR